MTDSAPQPELLAALGRTMRGLSALFWGLPLALVVCFQTAKGEWLRPLNVFPPLVVTGLLYYGLRLLGRFQKQERVWIRALDRAKLFALVNVGLSPFIFWSGRMPKNTFYESMVELFMISGLLLLFSLNPVLWRLAAMLPDETLRDDTRLFTRINCGLLAFILCVELVSLALRQINTLPSFVILFIEVVEHSGQWILLILILLPISMTMALIWKAKEVILSSVFGPEA